MNNIWQSPALFLVVAAAIGYIVPLVSAKIARPDAAPEVEGLITLVLSTLTGLAAELIHAASNDVDFRWSVWAATAATTVVGARIGQAQSWSGSETARKLRGAPKANVTS